MRTFIYSLLLIPFSWLYWHYHTCNPFAINSPTFLKFYLMLVGLSYLIILLQSPVNKAAISRKFYLQSPMLVFFSVYLLGIARLVRGIYLGRPVGYLTLILLVTVLLWIFVSKRTATDA